MKIINKLGLGILMAVTLSPANLTADSVKRPAHTYRIARMLITPKGVIAIATTIAIPFIPKVSEKIQDYFWQRAKAGAEAKLQEAGQAARERLTEEVSQGAKVLTKGFKEELQGAKNDLKGVVQTTGEALKKEVAEGLADLNAEITEQAKGLWSSLIPRAMKQPTEKDSTAISTEK